MCVCEDFDSLNYLECINDKFSPDRSSVNLFSNEK